MTAPQPGPQLAATGILAQYSTLARRNAQQTANYAGAVVEAVRDGVIPVAQAVAYLVEIIGAGAVTAALLADLSVAADLSKRTGKVVTPLSLDLPAQYIGTIKLGVQTIVDEADWRAVRADDPEEVSALVNRVERLARAVPLDVGQAVQQEALRKRDVVSWTRGTDADPCALCRSLADGTVLPITRQMLTHPGCCCQRVPVLDPDVQAGDKLSVTPPDVHEAPQRELTTGHGLGRVSYTTLGPGLRFQRSAPRVKDTDRFDPRSNGATEAARRANRGRHYERPLAPVIDLNEFRRNRRAR